MKEIQKPWLLRNHLPYDLVKNEIKKDFYKYIWDNFDVIGFKSIRLNFYISFLRNEFKDAKIIYIERIVSHQPLRHSMKVGDRVPAYCTALGKAMLAFSDEISVSNMLKEKVFIERNPKENIKFEKLLKEL